MLNLSSWAIQRESLGDWLTREVATRYEIPIRHVRDWIASDQLIPLLDGLDEVTAEHRAACVKAINDFRAQHGSVPIAICCRSEEYAELSQHLRVYGTVTILPLSRAQVDRFLDRAGAGVAGVRAALTADPTLWEMVESPLMLSIMALAFRDSPPEPSDPGELADERRQQIFRAYVRTMLRHRRSARYSPEETTRYLTTLAEHLQDQSQTVFTLDLINPRWLPMRGWRGHRWLASINGVLWGAFGAAALAAIAALAYGWRGAFLGAVAGAGFGLPATRRIDSWRSTKQQEWANQGNDRTHTAGDWLFATLLPIVIPEFWRPLGMALAGGVASGLVLGWSAGVSTVLAYGLATLVALYLGAALAYTYAFVSEKATQRESRGEVPSPRVRAALRPGIIAAGAAGVLVGVGTALIVAGPLTLVEGRRFGLVAGAGAALYALSTVGVYGALEQALLRTWLHKAGRFPKPGRPFLDHAVQCLFLRPVGGGYIFVHRELLEYFAELSAPSPAGRRRPGP
ncbi:NACHT domain-containing protein [Phytohabitans rumicis]|uniref:NACHT domain-containing protein n=1 Tax=Phytohabitans rumicis TaxID=1076125 RepID=A0A6V8L2M9_9ACTN|nr:hypothetical protein [Phytohabitans rumicis]GFJ89021.1 hypothetical protein Prum_026630 [Phytohabitans rumicis]